GIRRGIDQAERDDLTDDQSADRRTYDRPQPADDADRERQYQDRVADRRVDGLAWRDDHAPEPGQPRADDEHGGVEQRHVYARGVEQLRVRDRGADIAA